VYSLLFGITGHIVPYDLLGISHPKPVDIISFLVESYKGAKLAEID
jgi:hypothetical protein